MFFLSVLEQKLFQLSEGLTLTAFSPIFSPVLLPDRLKRNVFLFFEPLNTGLKKNQQYSVTDIK